MHYIFYNNNSEMRGLKEAEAQLIDRTKALRNVRAKMEHAGIALPYNLILTRQGTKLPVGLPCLFNNSRAVTYTLTSKVKSQLSPRGVRASNIMLTLNSTSTR